LAAFFISQAYLPADIRLNLPWVFELTQNIDSRVAKARKKYDEKPDQMNILIEKNKEMQNKE
jgi:hypothetical protein